MDLEIIILSQTDNYCDITYMWNLKKIQMNSYKKTEIDLTAIKNILMVTKG